MIVKTIILALLAWMLFMALFALVIRRLAKVPSLKTKRLYLDPCMDLAARKRLLSKEMDGDAESDFYNYYVVMPNEEIPVFNCKAAHLANAEFLIIEYFVTERIKVNAL